MDRSESVVRVSKLDFGSGCGGMVSDIETIMKTYRAPWGKPLIFSSALLVMLAVAGVFATELLRPYMAPAMPLLVAQWVLPVLVLGCLPFAIRGYAISEDAIIIQRLFWVTRLRRANLLAAEFKPNVMKGSLRTCGNGGAFSFSGWYWNRSLGAYHAYVTDMNRTVVLRFKRGTVVVSPESPEAFVKDLIDPLSV